MSLETKSANKSKKGKQAMTTNTNNTNGNFSGGNSSGNLGENIMILLGNVGDEKNINFTTLYEGTPNELIVGKFSFCTNIPMGGGRTEAIWHQIVIIGRIAKAIKPYVTKGKQMLIRGYFRNRKHVNEQTGVTSWFPETVVNDMYGSIRLLGGSEKKNQTEQDTTAAEAAAMAILDGSVHVPKNNQQRQPNAEYDAVAAQVEERGMPAEMLETYGRTQIPAEEKTGKKSKKDKQVEENQPVEDTSSPI